MILTLFERALQQAQLTQSPAERLAMSPSAATKAAPRASNGLLVNENAEWDAYVGEAVRKNAQLLVEG